MLASRHIEVLVMVLASFVAIYVGSHIVMLSIPLMAVVLFALFVIIWGLTAGNAWWMPILSGATIYGLFRVGVKVSPTLLAFGLSLIGLIPLILVKSGRAVQYQRKPLPLIFYLAGAYVVIRLLVDIIPAEGARTNLFRILFDASWPFCFGFLFHYYGSLSTARVAVGLAFVTLMIRCLASLIGYFTGWPLYIPGIDYVLSLGASDSLIAMRVVAASLMLVTMVIFHCTKTPLFKIVLAMIIMGSGLLVVMGAGRIATLLMLLQPLVFFSWSRNWLLVMLAACVGVGIVAFINVVPQSLTALPPVAARSLSGLVVGKDSTGNKDATKGSDEWHDALREEGFARWTSTPVTMVFGYGIRPTPELYEEKSFEEDPKAFVAIAADLGSYESGLWTVVGTIGALGFILYLGIFVCFWRTVLPYFMRRPEGTFWEGLIFWGCYSSIMWFACCNFVGSYPSLELVMMIISVDIINDGKMEREPARASVPRRTMPQLLHASYARARA